MRTTAFGMWKRQMKECFTRWPGFLLAAALVPLSSLSLHATPSVVTLGGGGALPAKNGGAGYVDGNTYNVAMFNAPAGMALDPAGTSLFLADYNNNAIRLISNLGNQSASSTITFANSTNISGIGGINHPLAVVVDSVTNVFVLNQGNGTNGAILHFSGLLMNIGVVLGYTNPMLVSNLVNATAMTADGYDNLYVTVNSNKVICVTTNKVVTTVGTIAQAGTYLQGIVVLDNGQLALTDSGNHGIWIMNPATGQSAKFCGFNGPKDTNGLAAFAAFNAPKGISKAGNGALIVADYGNHKVKQIDLYGTVSLLYGVSSNLWITTGTRTPGLWDGLGTPNQGDAEARYPFGVLVGPDGSVYTTEDYYHVVRHVTSTGLPAPKPGYPPQFNGPDGLAYDSLDNALYIADTTNNSVRILSLGDNATTTYLTSADGVTNPVSVLIDANENLYVLNQGTGSGYVLEFDAYGYAYGPIITNLNQPTAFTMDGYGNILVAEQSGKIRAFGTYLNNTVAIITNASVSLQGIALFDDGTIAVSDAGNDVLWAINPITKAVSRLTGQVGVSGIGIGGTNSARLNQPHQLARVGGNQIIAADSANNRLVLVQRNGTITTNTLNSLNASVWFGNGNDPVGTNSADFVPMVSPAGVAIGNGTVFTSEPRYADIRGLSTTITSPSSPPGVPVSVYSSVAGIALDNTLTELYITDPTNDQVRLLDLTDNSTTIFLDGSRGLYLPVDIAIGTNNNLFILNQGTNNGYILEFDQYGNAFGPVVTGLNHPTAFTLDGYGNLIVVEQSGAIRAFGAVSKTIATITNANVSLQGIALFDDGTLAVSDAGNDVIWNVNPLTKINAVLTGQLGIHGTAVGVSTFASLYQPQHLARAAGNQIVVADYGNNRLMLVQRNGTSSTNGLNSYNGTIWFGDNHDPVTTNSTDYIPMALPFGVAVGAGEIFTSEARYADIRGLNTTVSATTVNPGVPIPVYTSMGGVALNTEYSKLFVTDPAKNTLDVLNLLNNSTTIFLTATNGLNHPVDTAVDSSDNVYVLNQGTGNNGGILKFDAYGNLIATNAVSLAMPTAMFLDFYGNLYVTELSGLVQQFSGGSSNTVANITNANVQLEGVALLDNGAVVVSDAGNSVVWKLTTNAPAVLTGILGSPGANFGAVGFAQLNHPMRMQRAFNGTLVIADSGNNRVVVVDDLGTISRALNPTNATIWFGLSIDPVLSGTADFVPMAQPVGLAIGPGTGSNGVVYASENLYDDIRGMVAPGIQPAIAPPATPLNLVASVAIGQVSLTWSASSGANSYYVEHSPSSGGPYTIIATTTGTSYTDSEPGGSTNYYVVAAVNLGGTSSNSLEVLGVPLFAPPSAPLIGWFDYEPANFPVTHLYPVTTTTFYNDPLLAIEPTTANVSTFYTYDGTDPSTNSHTPPTNPTGPAYYEDGLSSAASLPLDSFRQTNLVLKAFSYNQGGSSAITTAKFIFQVASPLIDGVNASLFKISDNTANSQAYYTIDGSDPTNATNSTSIKVAFTNEDADFNYYTYLSLGITTNTTVKVRCFRDYYLPSAITKQTFIPAIPAPVFASVGGIAMDSSLSGLYIADPTNNMIRLLDLTDNSATVFLTASNGLYLPVDVALDPHDNLYILNQGTNNGYILEFDEYGNAYGPVVTGLNQPTALTMDGNGNLIVAEQSGTVLSFGSVSSTITTVTNASISVQGTNVSLQGIALFDDGTIAVSDAANHVIWDINPITKASHVLTGQLGTNGIAVGVSNFASLYQPRHLARAAGDQIIVADYGNNRVMLVQRNGSSSTNSFNSMNATVWYGDNNYDPVFPGSAGFVSMYQPVGVVAGAGGKFFTSEALYRDIRGLNTTNKSVQTVTPAVPLPAYSTLAGMALNFENTQLFATDPGSNIVRVLNLSDDSTTVFLDALNGLNHPVDVAVDSSDNVYVLNQGTGNNGSILEFDVDGNLINTNAVSLPMPTAMKRDFIGNLYVTELSGLVQKFSGSNSNTVANLTNANVQLQGVLALDNGTVVVSDAGNNVLWQITTNGPAVFTGILGSPGSNFGAAGVARLNHPMRLAQDLNGVLLIVDAGNNRVVEANDQGAITNALNSTNNATVWFGLPAIDPVMTGDANFVPMAQPVGLAIGLGTPTNAVVYTSENFYEDIRAMVAPDLKPGYPPSFSGPNGIAYDSVNNNLFIADYTNNAIELLNLNNNLTSVYLTAANGITNPVAVLVDTNANLYVLNQGTTSGYIVGFDKFRNVFGALITGLHQPTAFVLDSYGNFLVTEQSGAIRAFGPYLNNTVATVTNANVSLQGIALFDDGSIAVSDAGNQVLWLVNPITKIVSQLTGQLGVGGVGVGSNNFAQLNQPHQLARAAGNQIVAADSGNNRLVLVQRDGSTSTNLFNSLTASIWFGNNNDPVSASSTYFVPMVSPSGVAVGNGLIFASENHYADIRGLASVLVMPTTTPGVPVSVYSSVGGIALDSTKTELYITDPTNNQIRLLDLTDNSTTIFLDGSRGLSVPVDIALAPNNNLYVLNQGTNDGYILEFDQYGNAYGPIVTGLNHPTAFTLDAYGNLIIAEQSGTIRAFGTISNTIIATITNANVSLQGIALFDDGTIALSDAGNHVIWDVNPLTRVNSVLTGQLGTHGIAVGVSNFASLYLPQHLARTGGNQLVVADYGNNRLMQVQRNGTTSTNALNSLNGTIWFGDNHDPITTNSTDYVPMSQPLGVVAGADGVIFTSEARYMDIRGLSTTNTTPNANPGVPIPVYSAMAGIALNLENTSLFISDPSNNTVRVLNFLDNSTEVFLNASNYLNHPVDINVDNSDNVYVLNQGTGNNGYILEFDAYGNLLGTNALSLPMPTAMNRDFLGNIYVTELTGLIQEFTGSGSNTLATVTNANVQLQGVAVLDNGSVVVSDAGNHVLWKIGTNGPVLFTGVIGSPGTNFGAVGFAQLNQPMRLAEALNGKLVIADSGNNRVLVADDQGTIFSSLNTANATVWFGLPIDPIGSTSANFVSMLAPVGLAIGTGGVSNGVVYASENVYKDIRGMVAPGIRPPIAPPTIPLNLVASVTYGQVNLSWSPSIGATNYYVEHAASSGGPYDIINTTTGTAYTDFELGGSTNYYVVAAVNLGGVSSNSTEVIAVPLTPPPPAPRVGWFDYEGDDLTGYFSVLHPVSANLYNNDQLLAVDPVTNGISTFYTDDGTDPRISTTRKQPPYYADGVSSASPLSPVINPGRSNLVIKAVNIDTLSQTSAVTIARFLFKVANPTINGNNAAQFTISDQTSNTWAYYTLDGSDPTNAKTINCKGPVYVTNYANGTYTSSLLSETITTNTTIRVRGYRFNPNYAADPYGTYLQSEIAQVVFDVANYVPNIISFGFDSGEASSDFIAAAGQTFYAPITLSMLPGNKIYSLQYNVVATNAGPNPGPAIDPGAFTFQTMLVKPDPNNPGVYFPIPPYMYADGEGVAVDPAQLVNYLGMDFVNLVFTNDSMNLLGVGWLERAGATNLYNTKSQDLIAFSMAHDDLFTEAGGKIITGGYAFRVPTTAANGETYQIQIGRPSATSDGIGTPGSSVYIYAPTNGSYTNGAVNSIKYVTIGQAKYLAGSVYPFRWFNAGDFGSSNLVNADVMQVFQSAIYAVNYPPAGSDFFDAMDSCGGTYTTLANGILIQNTTLSSTNQTFPLFDGNDTTINQIAFGDGVLDVCDVYVTYRRSLDPSLTDFQRFWFKGQRVAQIVPNVSAASASASAAAKVASKISSATTVNPQVNFTATDVSITNGQSVVQVPITATILGNYPLRVLMLNLEVTPLDGSPVLTTPVSFTQTATVLGTPVLTSSSDNGNYAAVWLNSTNAGLTGTNIIGYLTVTLPATATATAAYAIHFDHASASPNGLGSFPKQTLTGLITLSSRTNSYFNDGIPDVWRLRWFGSIYNVLSASNACPTGDGINNWSKFVAGVDPEAANDFPRTMAKAAPAGATAAITWPSVSGKQYVIERSFSLFNGSWTAISTNTGNGADMEFDDTNAGKAMFYRVLILP